MSGTNTVFAQIASEAFGLPTGLIRVVNADTEAAPYAGSSGGSKITYTVGAAVEKAARDARQQLFAIAARHLEAAVEDLELVDRAIQVRGAPAKAINADELAAKLGKSRSYVFGRLKLLSLVAKARDAAFDGTLSTSIALLVARIPADRQPQALKEILFGYGGEPMTHAAAFVHIKHHYMLELARAPFKITDATLLPAAGSCRECPKRTGANPDLFNDVKSADTCTDPTCFDAKVQAE